MIKTFDTVFGNFEEYTTRKEASQFVKGYKYDCEGEVFEGDSLYVRYTDGTELLVFGGESTKGIKVSNIESMIYEGEYGTTFYNAIPQMDKMDSEDQNDWLVRVGTHEGEYGETVSLETVEEDFTVEVAEVEEEVEEENRENKTEEQKEEVKTNMVWLQAQEIGYEPKTTFWQDFSIADMFGARAIKDTFERAFKEWKGDYVYLTELVMVLNHKIWQWYTVRDEYGILYDRLYRQAHDYALSKLKDDELLYYLETTD